MASAMPVLPLVGSKIVSPIVSRPSASAARTIHSAARSFTLPVGFAVFQLRPQADVGRGRKPGQPDERRASAGVDEAVEPGHD